MTLWNRISIERAEHTRNMLRGQHAVGPDGKALCRLEPRVPRLTWFAARPEEATCTYCKQAMKPLPPDIAAKLPDAESPDGK